MRVAHALTLSLALGLIGHAASDSAFLFAEEQDFDEAFEDTRVWAVLFTSLEKMDLEEHAKRIYLLVPHHNYTFVQFASSTVEEVPQLAAEFGVTVDNVPRVLLFNRMGSRVPITVQVDCGEDCQWDVEPDPPPGTESDEHDQLTFTMASRMFRADALGSAMKDALEAAGNPSELSTTRIPSTMVHRDRVIPNTHRFPIYSKLPVEQDHDEI